MSTRRNFFKSIVIAAPALFLPTILKPSWHDTLRFWQIKPTYIVGATYLDVTALKLYYMDEADGVWKLPALGTRLPVRPTPDGGEVIIFDGYGPPTQPLRPGTSAKLSFRSVL